ncbi:hypothetical protein [Lutispora sp.]|uniref:hypothetical protein n=1 Tax=Lutispora sp. TaxID=2828727 RepID=UPI0035689568
MKSDIDILVVVEDAITELQKKMFIDGIMALNDDLPAKGLELSIVRSEYCKNFVTQHPLISTFQICISLGIRVTLLNI